eukprot:2141184-Prymnesium_polylepis.2
MSRILCCFARGSYAASRVQALAVLTNVARWYGSAHLGTRGCGSLCNVSGGELCRRRSSCASDRSSASGWRLSGGQRAGRAAAAWHPLPAYSPTATRRGRSAFGMRADARRSSLALHPARPGGGRQQTLPHSRWLVSEACHCCLAFRAWTRRTEGSELKQRRLRRRQAFGARAGWGGERGVLRA